MLIRTANNKPSTATHHQPQTVNTTTQKNSTATDNHPLPPSKHPNDPLQGWFVSGSSGYTV